MKVYRKEFFSLNPSFEDTSEIVCDEELLIEDLRFDYEEFYDESIDLVLDKVIQKITDDFK